MLHTVLVPYTREIDPGAWRISPVFHFMPLRILQPQKVELFASIYQMNLTMMKYIGNKNDRDSQRSTLVQKIESMMLAQRSLVTILMLKILMIP